MAARATAPFESTPTPKTPLPTADTSTSPAPGDKITEWIKSPFDVASFGPRLTVGYALSRLAQPSKLQDELETLRNLLQSPAPLEDKGKLVAAELEQYASCRPVLDIETVTKPLVPMQLLFHLRWWTRRSALS